MPEYSASDLVLTVSQHTEFDAAPYEEFIDQLCLDLPYQAEGIAAACRYLLGTRYASLNDLAKENWDARASDSALRERYNNSFPQLMGDLELGDYLSASVDHATGTGKSYVMYGVAVIALASGLVDRVLVLCPSLTIEAGLTAKFRELTQDSAMLDLLPQAEPLRPQILNAYEQSVPDGSICIENIHAAYDRSQSSIRDSFRDAGARTLVINDEAHHVFGSQRDGEDRIKQWITFLKNPDFAFRRILNVSGTCFIGNDYFPDVIHRYSLRDALDDKVIKDIRYLADAEGSFETDEQRWTAILEEHRTNQTKYPKVKPLTIFVCPTQAKAKSLHTRFQAFLMGAESLDTDEAAARTLVVTSASEHKENVAALADVDNDGDPVQFIFSVAMLTEGWDVNNVFQIVPDEEKAFNSKLLIAQVLGRGLRLPPAYRIPQPRVVVFNHAKWSKSIEALVAAVMESDQRVTESVLRDSPFNFVLDNISYEREKYTRPGESIITGRAAGRELSFTSRVDATVGGSWEDVATRTSARRENRLYQFHLRTRSVDEVVDEALSKLAAWAMARGEEVDTAFERDSITSVVEQALKVAGRHDGRVTDENLQTLLEWLKLPSGAHQTQHIRTKVSKLVVVSTASMQRRSVARTQLAKDWNVALLTDNGLPVERNGESDQYPLLRELLQDTAVQDRFFQCTDVAAWKTPVDLVITSHTPERLFVQHLLTHVARKRIDAWVKSPDQDFYAIPYTQQRRGSAVKNGTFNPDFFLKCGSDVVIVEIKEDAPNSVTDENRAKLIAAEQHVKDINRLRGEDGRAGEYKMFFLSPSDYLGFFAAVENGAVDGFTSKLHARLKR